MNLKRYEDWPERLEAFLKEAREKEFAWGSWDCALFACSAGLAMTGEDFGARFRGTYDDASGAARALREFCAHSTGAGSDLEKTATIFLGPPLPSPKKAQRGDAVLFESDEGPALGIVDLSGTHFAVLTTKGILRLKMERAAAAWRV